MPSSNKLFLNLRFYSGDLAYDSKGYTLVLLNNLFTAAYSICLKKVDDKKVVLTKNISNPSNDFYSNKKLSLKQDYTYILNHPVLTVDGEGWTYLLQLHNISSHCTCLFYSLRRFCHGLKTFFYYLSLNISHLLNHFLVNG